jgi:hypothetical protein
MFRLKKYLFPGFCFVWLTLSLLGSVRAQNDFYQLAVLKYRGGGDWYANPTAVPNLVAFCNEKMGMMIDSEVATVDIGSSELFDYPWIHMTGHGNVVFSASEARNLKTYLEAGGFLHISDNYGMDPYVRRELRKVFPESDWVELPWSHEVFHSAFEFDQGLPKIHEHDDEPARGYGMFHEGRLVVFYDYESDLGDGWEDWQVHRDPEDVRLLALRMGANLITKAFGGKVN